MKVYNKINEELKDGMQFNEVKPLLDQPLDMAYCTATPKIGGTFSIRLPALDWEDGMQATYVFQYDGKADAKETTFPASLTVTPVANDIPSHCMNNFDGNVGMDCELKFEESKPISIQTEFMVSLTEEEIHKLNAYLNKWPKK